MIFPQRTWKILKNAQKRQKKVGEGGGGAITAPRDQDTTLYGSKPLLRKRIVNQTIVGGKDKKN